MFGGVGGGPSSLRFIRLGALVVILIVGTALRHSGSAYRAIYWVYLVVIVCVIAASFARRGRGRRGGGSTGGGGGFGTPPPTRPIGDNPDPEAGDQPPPGYSAR
jgi:hypothetical protein